MNSSLRLTGEVTVPGDKSITHRAIMFGAVAEGESVIKTNMLGRDNFATLRVMRQLGVSIDGELAQSAREMAEEEALEGFSIARGTESIIRVNGCGFPGLKQPDRVLDCGNSGTTARLLTGLLAGRPFGAELTGDDSLRKRPFKRVTEPLRQMGASFSGNNLPLTVAGGKLKGIDYRSDRASAQVKTAILLAGLQCTGTVSVTEPRQSRDHTERMFAAMGSPVKASQAEDGWRVVLSESARTLKPIEIEIPGDFSSAAFFIVAASVIPGSFVVIRNVGLNSTRRGLFQILSKMGALIGVENQRLSGGEEIADLVVKASPLRAVDIGAEEVLLAIDEIPILAVAAAFAHGATSITGAEELRVKESDRLSMISSLMKSSGIEVAEARDGLTIIGQPDLLEGSGRRPLLVGEDRERWLDSGDHRILMSGAILEYILTGKFSTNNPRVVETSFPGFSESFCGLMG